MTGLVPLLAGAALLWLVWSDRRNLRREWMNPARWWSFKAAEPWRSRSPSQPLNVVLRTVLGLSAVVYGILALVS
jgi:hypothetical protein